MVKDFKQTIEFTLQEKALHELAKLCWGNFVLRESNSVRVSELELIEKLVTHRKGVVKNISQIFINIRNIILTNIPKRLSDKLVDALICLQQGYIEALNWEQIYESIIYSTTNTILNPLTAGQYSAKNFIDPAGHFDDLCWAKCFVADENQTLQSRYTLACTYCFEETIRSLFNALKIKAKLSFEGSLALIRSNDNYQILALLWAYQLENKFHEIEGRESATSDDFYKNGFIEACRKNYGFAVRFFWTHFSDELKAYHIRSSRFNFLTQAAKHNQAGLVNFIYSSLSLEQKKSLALRSIFDDEVIIAHVWCCLLHSQFSETALNDIFTPPFIIPSRGYECFVSIFIDKMGQLHIPTDIVIFTAIWNHLTKEQQKQCFYRMFYKIGEINFTHLLKMMIQSLSFTEEENVLFDDWQRLSKSTLVNYTKLGDYDVLLRFLLFFLIDHNPSTQELFLRTSTIDFLDSFLWGRFFDAWTKIQIQEKQIESNNVHKIKLSLQVSLQVLKVCVNRKNSCVKNQKTKRSMDEYEEEINIKRQKKQSRDQYPLQH